MKSYTLQKSIQFVNGVGEKRALLLKKIGINTIEDALYFFPRNYEDRTKQKKINELIDGDECSFYAKVVTEVSKNVKRKNLTIYRAIASDSTAKINILWFNQHYIVNNIIKNNEYIFYGKIKKEGSSIHVINPIYERIGGKNKAIGCIMPIYSLTANLTQNIIVKIIDNIFSGNIQPIEDFLPLSIRKKYKLSELNYCLKNIHFPETFDDLKNARYRLVFEELLLFQIGLLKIKNDNNISEDGISFDVTDSFMKFKASIPFKLTNAQDKVINEIIRDMSIEKPMNRLVQGDVGSGKTIVAILAMYIAVKNGYQVVMMVPTEILAEQHYKDISNLFEKFSIQVELLTGSQTKKNKELIKKKIKDGNVDVIIGTHALIQGDVIFNKLGLVITDEQHRFGVKQRIELAQKAKSPDVLVMTATPIPRTLALILYGDLDISIIDEMPPNRQKIDTFCVSEDKRERINSFIIKNVKEGRHAYIVCPLVEESEALDLQAATKLYEKIAREELKELKVGLIHGKMKPRDKERIMKEFVLGNIDVLVSTTVIEVGVNVPNANLMIIENAERFGLAQLHQLRGRVGRGQHKSYCILYNQAQSVISKKRMDIMVKTNNGFEISEKDLEIRGPGDFFGTKQHGLPDFKIANLYNDLEVLKTAQIASEEIMKNESSITEEERNKLNKYFDDKFKEKLKTIAN